MKNWKSPISRIGSLLLSLTLAALLISGCGLFDAPTASDDSTAGASPEFWNPGPGDEVVPGREVPILENSYWEDLYGPQINPWLTRPSNGGIGGIAGIDGIIEAARDIIGAVGGTVTLGNHYYVVPSGAVNGIVRFSLAYASITGVAVDCGPSPMSFDMPVMLTLSFAGTQYAAELDPSDLRIFYMNEDGEMEAIEGCIVNTRAQTVSAPVTHFSRYILG